MHHMKLEAIRTVVSHDSCPDGTASAMIIRDVLPNVEFQFIQHNTPEHRALRPRPGVLFVDFTPFVGVGDNFDPALLRDWAQSGSIVLDHHKTARHVVEAFGENGVFGDEVNEPGVCGAVLAYREVWDSFRKLHDKLREAHGQEGSLSHAMSCGPEMVRAANIERFARLAGIRDTWVRNSPDWNLACRQATIMSFVPRDRWMSKSLDDHLANWGDKFEWIGEILEDRQKRSVEKSIKGGYRFTSERGTRVIVFESVSTTSDACETLASEVDLVLGYSTFVENGTLKTVFSSRTRGSFNCAEFATRYGGGGHTKAAGFAVSGLGSHPIVLAERLVNEYESSL